MTREEEDQDEELVESEELLCKVCGSTEIHRRPRARYFIVIAAVAIGIGALGEHAEAAFYVVAAAAIFSIISDRWVCMECGNSWK